MCAGWWLSKKRENPVSVLARNKPEDITDPQRLAITIEGLVEDGTVTRSQAEHLRDSLQDQLGESRYILKNLAAHLSIGIVFAFDIVPLPLGTVARVCWVAFGRLIETIRGNSEKAKVHSLGVLLIAAIPWFGYAAYLLPLRRDNKELAFVIANRLGNSHRDLALY